MSIKDRKPKDRPGYVWVYCDGCDCAACPWGANCVGREWPHWESKKKAAGATPEGSTGGSYARPGRPASRDHECGGPQNDKASVMRENKTIAAIVRRVMGTAR